MQAKHRKLVAQTQEVSEWCDLNGQPLSTEQLQRVSRNWSQETWERYLKTLESPLSESQVSSKKYARISEESASSVFDFVQPSSNERNLPRLRQALNTLTFKQRLVVDFIFYGSQSSREVASRLAISQSTVRDLKRKALKNLRAALQGGALTSPLVKGQSKKEAPND